MSYELPDCANPTCGHLADVHNDNPSHTAVTFCKRCGCNEYLNPDVMVPEPRKT